MQDLVKVMKEQINDVCTLSISGVLDYSTMEPFVDEIRGISSEINKVIVNFEELEFIDSTGIGAIINLVHEAKDKRFIVELDGINEEVKELFDAIGVFRIIGALQGEGE